MVTAIPANQITLYDLRVKFGLQRTDDEQFFQEWQDDLPELTELEKKELKEIKRDYLHLSERPMVETIVKMVVLSPLLKLAGFYRYPFYITAEKVLEITSEDQETIITGRLDLLIYTPEFWVLVIEAKRADYSLEVGIPQALSYMLGNIESERPAFGFITNGPDFIFLKLSKDNTPKYGESDSFSLRNKTGLEQVLKILKRFNQLVKQ